MNTLGFEPASKELMYYYNNTTKITIEIVVYISSEQCCNSHRTSVASYLKQDRWIAFIIHIVQENNEKFDHHQFGSWCRNDLGPYFIDPVKSLGLPNVSRPEVEIKKLLEMIWNHISLIQRKTWVFQMKVGLRQKVRGPRS